MDVVDTFFSLLDACVTADSGPAGLRGRIGVGVLGERAAWWVADFGDTTALRRSVDAPDGCDAALLLDEAGVARQLAGGEARPLQTFGDIALLDRFASRFVRRQGAMGLRLHAMTRGAR
ncbi:MAG: hypothetical protein RMA76_27925 [Deltaproteobacteria bacterium]